MKQVYNYDEPKEVIDSYVLCYEDYDTGDVHKEEFQGDDFKVVMSKASRIECFSDCFNICNVEVLAVSNLGVVHKITYAGWKPDMLMEWYWEDGEIAWSQFYPEWDH